MSKYVIITDSAGDLELEEVKALGVEVIPLSLNLGEEVFRDFPDRRELDPKVLYTRLRAGEVGTTSAVNMDEAKAAMRPYLEAGTDVLLLAFSSGLSTTCQSDILAGQELAKEFPQRKIFVVDTLCASRGEGLLVWLAVQEMKKGKTIEEVRDFVEDTKLHLCHWFTVDDLFFLKRGGRVSAASAALGTVLSIKPVLHVDDEGHLINMAKARGRRASIKAMVDKAAETAIDPAHQTMFICHGDCLEDAEYLAELVRERLGTQDIRIGYTGPVIGAHSGPGTLALFFLGDHR